MKTFHFAHLGILFLYGCSVVIVNIRYGANLTYQLTNTVSICFSFIGTFLVVRRMFYVQYNNFKVNIIQVTFVSMDSVTE